MTPSLLRLRIFGAVLAAIALGIQVSLRVYSDVEIYAFHGIAAAAALLAVLRPTALEPLYRAWLPLQTLLARATLELVSVAVYLLVICVAGGVRRLLGRSRFRRRPASLTSTWIKARGTSA